MHQVDLDHHSEENFWMKIVAKLACVHVGIVMIVNENGMKGKKNYGADLKEEKV